MMMKNYIKTTIDGHSSSSSSSMMTTALSKRKKRESVQYLLAFEDVFDSDELRDCYMQYLAKEHNREPLQFLLEVEDYKRLKATRNRLRRATEIVDRFVRVNAPDELNLEMEIRRSVCDALLDVQSMRNDHSGVAGAKDSSRDRETLVKLFDTLYSVVFLELKHDSFPRFLDSRFFKRYMSNKNKSFIEEVNATKVVRIKEMEEEEEEEEEEENGELPVVSTLDFSQLGKTPSPRQAHSPHGRKFSHITQNLTPRSQREIELINFDFNPMITDEEWKRAVEEAESMEEWELMTNKDDFQSYLSKQMFTAVSVNVVNDLDSTVSITLLTIDHSIVYS